MKLSEQSWVGLRLLPAAHLWSQVDNPRIEPVPALVGPGNPNDPMLIPPPVSGQSYPTSPTSAERSNYLRGGIAFTSAYTDNALGSVTGHPVSDIGYSIMPMLALD